MLIDLHGHHFSKPMMDLDPHWGPSWVNGTLKIGEWSLGTKKLPDLHQVSKADQDTDAIFQRWSHEFRLQVMERLGVDMLVLSVPSHMYMYWTGDFGVRFAQVTNDELAKYVAADPVHFQWWAHVPMHDPPQAAKELERAVGMGAIGFSCGGSNFGGLNLHSRELDVFWAKVEELGVPAFVHGYNHSVSWGDHASDDPFDTTTVLGMCYDEATAFWHLIKGGVLDRFPGLRFYITHAGGYVPYQLFRLVQMDTTMAPDAVNGRPLSEYMPNFWFDPQIHNAGMRRAMVDIIGVDQLVYGSNFMGSDQIDFDLTDEIGLSDEDREKIKSGNAIELLKLEAHIAAAR
jgi:aminocarboxymuconate-semialdehyde decarboxylase